MPRRRPPSNPIAGTPPAETASFPDAEVAAAVALLLSDDTSLPAAAVAEVKNELALARTLLALLSMLLRSDVAAVAALERRLEATDSAEDATEEASDSREETAESTVVGTLLAMDDANDAADVTSDPPTEVASPTTEVTSETTESMTEPILVWAAALAAKARNKAFERCMAGYPLL